MLTLDLRAEGQTLANAFTPMPELNDDDRHAAIATWRGRMVNEHISSRVFAALVPQLMRAGIDTARIEAVSVMIGDELRHGRLCAAMVEALGGEARAPYPELSAIPDHADASPLEAVLRNVLSICCLSETVAVSLISAERLRAGQPDMARTLDGILADEVRHSRFGWTLLEAVQDRLDDATRARLSRYLVVAFRHLLAHELAHLPEGPPPGPAAEAVGVCDGDESRALFFDTVAEVIVPRLEALGLAAAPAWDEARGVGAAVCLKA